MNKQKGFTLTELVIVFVVVVVPVALLCVLVHFISKFW